MPLTIDVGYPSVTLFLNFYSIGKVLVNIISSVLYGDNTAVLTSCDNGDRLTAIASKRKQEGVELLIICIYFRYNIFLTLFSSK